MPVKQPEPKEIYQHAQEHAISLKTEESTLSNMPVLQLFLVGRVFTNGLRDLGSIPGGIIPKTLKMVLDTYLLNTLHYKVRIRGKVEQSWERSSAVPYTSV